MNADSSPPCAVVVGLCAHGLGIVRSLSAAGIQVEALEANPDLPGVRTRKANVHLVEDINGPGLIDALLGLRRRLPADNRPVLILTNDNMVRTVGARAATLLEDYRLSWGHCAEQVLRLLDKTTLEAHCRELGLAYPKSHLLQQAPAGDFALPDGLAFPVIVKPAHPLSGFKVRLVHSARALEALCEHYANALPFLLQQWIPGDDRQLIFVALYLNDGEVLNRFIGRKLASSPPAMGQTTIAESYPAHEQALATALRFFEPLALSGPVSLEVKLDSEGTPWIIEPTLGRTDYWLDCCNANGVPLGVSEYQHQAGLAVSASTQKREAIWFDTERTPSAYMRFRLALPPDVPAGWRARFTYWDRSDPQPFFHGMRRTLASLSRRAWGRLTSSVG